MHDRILHLYAPLFVVLLLIPCFLMLGRFLRIVSLGASVQLRTIHRFILFSGLVAMVGIAHPLLEHFRSLWVIDALLGGLLFWTLGATYLVFRKRGGRPR